MRTPFVILVAGALAISARAQIQAAFIPGAPMPVSVTIRRLVPEVQMVFTAEDPHGRPVLNLSPQQITIFDNGVAAPLTSFQAAGTLPLRAALLLDASDSMRPGFAAERRAALAFARGMRERGEQIFTISFAARPVEAGSALPAGDFIPARQMGGQTALYDAFIAASQVLDSSTPGRRVLVLFSDGEDNYSRATLAEAIAALQHAGIALYSITVHSPRLEYPGDRVLRKIADATGGRAFLLSNYSRAAKTLAGIEEEVRGQYIVGFRPSSQLSAGVFHLVKIAASRGVRLRTRPGYYVEPAE